MDTREKILRRASQLFFTRGIKHVTMDELAMEVGISKRTIYEVFKDKYDLLQASIHFFQNEREQLLKNIIDHSENVIDSIVRMLNLGLESTKLVTPIYLHELKKFYPEVWDETIRKSRESSHDKLQKLLDRGKQEGVFRDDINSRLVARIFYEQMFLVHNKDIFPEEEFPTKELYENIFLNFARGICTLKGLKMLEELLTDPKTNRFGL